jgi:hypothetical protein
MVKRYLEISRYFFVRIVIDSPATPNNADGTERSRSTDAIE